MALASFAVVSTSSRLRHVNLRSVKPTAIVDEGPIGSLTTECGVHEYPGIRIQHHSGRRARDRNAELLLPLAQLDLHDLHRRVARHRDADFERQPVRFSAL